MAAVVEVLVTLVVPGSVVVTCTVEAEVGEVAGEEIVVAVVVIIVGAIFCGSFSQLLNLKDAN